MKKSYLMIAVAALAMASCAQNDELNYDEFKEAAMEFNIDGIENATRAELTTTWFDTADNSFGVYGYKKANFGEQIFNNEKVTAEGSKLWSHPTVRFWDKSVNTYNFYAYAPYNASGDVEFSTSNGFTFKNLSIFAGDIASGDYDKAIAWATGIGYTNGTLSTDLKHNNTPTVPFIFKHVLSKLQFKVKTDVDATLAKIYLQEIKAQLPTGTASWAQTSATTASGSATYSSLVKASLVKENASGDVYASADASADAAKFAEQIFASTEASGDAVSATAAQKGNTYIVVPVDNTNETDHRFAIKVKYDIIYSDGTYEKDCYALGAIKYAPNSNDFYTITININPAQIEFSVESIDDWTNKDGGTIDVE